MRVERGPVGVLRERAAATTTPCTATPAAADAAGFAAIPAPPTFTFAMQHMGRVRRGAAARPDERRRTRCTQVMGDLYAKGALVLHGEQEFEYHRPIMVGDVLVGEGKIVDLYEKETESAMMTFIVMETVWRDEATGDPVVTEQLQPHRTATKK